MRAPFAGPAGAGADRGDRGPRGAGGAEGGRGRDAGRAGTGAVAGGTSRDPVAEAGESADTGPGVRLHARVAARDLDLQLDVAGGQVVALLGPNGAGKSSVLSLVAGLFGPDEGRIDVGDRTLLDTARRIDLPAHARGVGMLTQDPLLFPHLDVLANVAFGPRSAGVGRRAAQQTAKQWLETLDVADLADRRPAHLSGGQAQRVAVARALAVEPQVLLLDEPLAALDIAVAAQLRPVLRRVCRAPGRTTLVVTHDLLDVLALADRIAVIESGRVVEEGETTSVLQSPRSAFAARLAGLNLVSGIADGQGGLRAPGGALVTGRGEVPADHAAVALFPPTAVAVFADPPGGSPRNMWRSRIIELTRSVATEGSVHVRVEAEGVGAIAADITPAAATELHLEPGATVYLAVKAQEVTLHQRD